MKSRYFDHVLTAEMDFSDMPVNNLAEFIFRKIPHRDEHAGILLSHDDNRLVTVSLKRLRYLVFSLYHECKQKNIKPGQTILLASISGNNELFTALLFLALSSFGVKVFLPMYMETADLPEWIDMTGCSSIILPGKEIFTLNHYDQEKSIVTGIREIAQNRNLPCFDSFGDFHIQKLLYEQMPDADFMNEPIVREVIRHTSPDTEALFITTSGSSGKSKIVVYTQGAFIRSCMSWQKAGLYDRNKLGGRGFTPLFTHTMGIRAFFNALWSGVPVCLIKTEWFTEKPETVRYFLMQMKPEHITGGPSVYNLLLELIRNFPELKSTLKSSMKTMISSGSPLDAATSAALESSFDLSLKNAFGTTETQQVMNTLLYRQPARELPGSLGAPLPGVKIGLKKLDDAGSLYRLYISSPFGMKRHLTGNEQDAGTDHGYFNSGDIVKLSGDDVLHYVGRENRDFFNDGFGVKVPLNSIKTHYQKLYDITDHIEFYPLNNTPGLAALLFITDAGIQQGLVTDKRTINTYASLIESIHVHLSKTLEPFEVRHRLISRFTLVNANVPKTVKGNPSQEKISTAYHDIIKKLADTLSNDMAIRGIKPVSGVNPFTKYHNPCIGHLLTALGMDKTYHRAKKDSLFAYQNGESVEILDLTGGYGTNLLGHNNGEIKNSVRAFLQNDEVPISDQGSIQKYAGMLAQKLNLLVGKITGRSYTVLFGSTGAEAVEMALHHALFEWRKKLEKAEQLQHQRYGAEAGCLVKEVWESNRKILSQTRVQVLAIKNSFHGSTSGARSLLSNDEKREAFQNMLGIEPIFIDDRSAGWNEQLEQAVNARRITLQEVVFCDSRYVVRDLRVGTIIASMAEPVLGEGGIRRVDPRLLDALSKFDFPLIMDEIQCGLGRCGSFLASEGIGASYYLFGKSLGGNMEKISAVLIEKSRYLEEFGKYYTSTFSNGGLAAHVALKTLSIITGQHIPQQAKEQGEKLREKLLKIQAEYPSVIAEITGEGLMQGIRFTDLSEDHSAILRNLYRKEYCGLLYASYLLNVHRIRILPTLSAPNTLRIEPSAFITDAEIDRFTESVKDLAAKISNRQFYELFSPLMDGDPFTDNRNKLPEEGFMDTSLQKPAENAVKVAMIAHFVYPAEELRALEKDLCKASDTGLRILFNRMQILLQMKPFVLLERNLYGGRIHFTFIAIPLDSAELERLHKQNKRRKIVQKIQEAVDLASTMGIQVVSLGAYTSILSNNGLSLAEPENTKIITGNTLTAASGIRRLIEQISQNAPLRDTHTLGIIGASGNIGTIITEGLLESDIPFDKVYLIGRNGNKLAKTYDQISQAIRPETGSSVEIATDLGVLRECNIVVIATNTNNPIVFPHHLNENRPVIISDLSIPKAVSKEVLDMPNILDIPFASYIALPEDPGFLISSHTPRGAMFCCASEAILLGFEPVDLELKGKITREGIHTITGLAEKYGFFTNLGTVKTFKPNH